MMKEFRLQEKQIDKGGQVVVIGGSKLFHGAPLLSLKTASRIVEMVFFASPEPSVGKVAEKLKSKLTSFIWIPFDEVGEYIKKSDGVLIGPGLMRYRKEGGKKFDEIGKKSKEITERFLQEFPQKQWVIDAGSLQVMDPKFIPKKAIITPNPKEFEILFGQDLAHFDHLNHRSGKAVFQLAEKYQCIIVFKGSETLVCSPNECRLIKGGNEGLAKGGTGDVLAGLSVALAAKNPPFLAACAASWIVKKGADELYKKVGFAYNADDLAEKTPEVLEEYLR